MKLDVLEIVDVDKSQRISVVCGHGEDGDHTFGWSVHYNEGTGKLVGKLTVSPRRFYIGQRIRKVLPALIHARLAECT